MRFIFASLCTAILLAGDISYRIDTIAGSDYVGDNGPAIGAILFQADGIASDATGSLYISDAADHRIRKISRTGLISTYAGTGIAGFSGDNGPAASAQINSPYGLAVDGAGNLYFADLGNARVRKIDTSGVITTIAGGGSIPAGGANEGSLATLLALKAPRNVAWDGRGSIYISDFGGHRVYRLAADGALTTAAGSGVQGYSGDGSIAVNAQLSFPAAIAVDVRGNLYVGDSQNHLIRKVTGGIITSIGRAALPTGMAVDGFGTLYIADPTAGQIETIPASGPVVAYPIAAQDLCFGPDGYVYATDGKLVRRISFTGPSTLIGGGGNLAYGDRGSATLARLNHPSGVASDAAGNIFIADRDNNRVRKVAPDGTISTIAGTGDAGDAPDGILSTIGPLSAPSAVAADTKGNIYIADTGNQRVRMILPNGGMRRLPVAGLGSPSYVLPDQNGNLYVADSANGTILEVTSAGTVIVAANLKNPRGLALDSRGNLYVTEVDGRHVKRLSPNGNVTVIAEGLWSVPRGIAIGADDSIYVADTGLQQILRIDSTGLVTAIAGTGLAGFSGDGGDALSAQLGFPWDVANGPAGTILIADLNNNRIRRLTPGPATQVSPVAVITAVNAASLQPGAIAPGMLLDLFGTGIASADNAQILFNGITSPILSADKTRVLVRVPPQLAGQSTALIQVLSNNVIIGEIPAAVVDAAPALFVDASGQLIASNQDGTANSAANPASRGSIIVFFGTGEGVTGAPISVSIGNYPADVLYAGPVAGYPGLFQVNARIPTGYVPPGILTVVVTAGQVATQPNLTIAVN